MPKLSPLLPGAWVMVWWVWFQLQRPAWVPRAVALLTVGFMVSTVIGENLLYPLITPSVGDVFHTVSIGVRFILLVVLIPVVILGIRRQGAESWLVLPAVVLLMISLFSTELLELHIRINWFPFGLRFSLSQVANLLLTVVLFALLLHRLLLSVRQQRLLALDVKQAQEVQQVILPQARTTVPGLMIESEYRPAREVGGDFFQIILSDGIAEATGPDGQLFGFERVHELLQTAKSATEVASTAQSFGQEDDISVITVTRIAVLEPALA